MSTLRLLWSILTPPHRFQARLMVALLLVAAFFESVGLSLILPVIGLMTAPDKIMAHPAIQPVLAFLGTPSHTKFFFILLASLNIVFVFSMAYRVWVSWYQTRYLNSLKVNVATNLYKAYMRQPWPFYMDRHTSTLIQNASKEIELLIQYGFASALNLARESVFILVVAAMLVLMAPLPAILAILSLLPLAWVFQKISRMRIRLWADKRQALEAQRIKTLQESLSLIKEIKLINKEQVFIERFQSQSSTVAMIEGHQSFMRQLTRPVFELYAILSISLAIIMMWRSGIPFDEIAPILGLFALAVLRFIPSINQILISLHGLRYIFPTAQLIADDLYLRTHDASNQEITSIPFNHELLIHHLTYQHPGSSNASLKDVDLAISKGHMVGIIGQTGAGKSTLIDLIMGLLQPQSGDITIDGISIFDTPLGWQRQIGYVGQNITLLDDSLRMNIALGQVAQDINDERIYECLEAAQLTKLVQSLPNGLDTFVGERGSRISGGERQRLGLARALYPNPTVLILDEATSALDKDSEALIMNAIAALKMKMTIIMITHRLETLAACDKVFLLQDGALEETTHSKINDLHSRKP